MKFATGPLFHAPFNVLKAIELYWSAPPRVEVPTQMVYKKKLSIADVAKVV